MSATGSTLPGLGGMLGLSATYQIGAVRQATAQQVEYNVQIILNVAQEFTGLVQDMQRTEMTPAQLARLDSVIADFETIIRKVQALRADIQVNAPGV
jgi:hypothetical protein